MRVHVPEHRVCTGLDLPSFVRKVDKKFVELNLVPYGNERHVVGPCHHGMARPQIADRGTASDKEGSCE